MTKYLALALLITGFLGGDAYPDHTFGGWLFPREHETYKLKVCIRTREKYDIDLHTRGKKSKSPKEFYSRLAVCGLFSNGLATSQSSPTGKIENNNEPADYFTKEGKFSFKDKRFENATVRMSCFPNQSNANFKTHWHKFDGYKGLCEIEYYKHPKFKWFERWHKFGSGG